MGQAEAIMREVAGWFPGRRLPLSADGFYATLAGRALPNAHLTSRMRSDLNATPAFVVSGYAGRWLIEDTFRNVKQYLGGEALQCWKGSGSERAVAFSFWGYSAV